MVWDVLDVLWFHITDDDTCGASVQDGHHGCGGESRDTVDDE
jgi:hypothetical protein